MSKKKIKLSKFYYHEALDRTHVISMIIETHLIEHPVFMKRKKLRKKIEKIQDILYDVYQDVGNLEFKKH